MYNVKTKKYRQHTQTVIYEQTVRGGSRHLIHQEKRGEGDREKSTAESIRRAKSAVYDIAHSNSWEWFITFTFNGQKVDRYNYDEVAKKLSRWLNNTQNRVCPEMVYLVVPELHKDGAWHFHGLFSGVEGQSFGDSGFLTKGLTFTDSGIRTRGGLTVYNVGNYRWGYTTATRVQDTRRASSYLTKYLTKELEAVTFNKRRYWRSKKCATPGVSTLYLDKEGVRVLGDTLADSTFKVFATSWGETVQVLYVYTYDNLTE